MPEQYIPMLKGEINRDEYWGGRKGQEELIGYTEYSIVGEDWIKHFLAIKGEESLKKWKSNK